MQGRHSNHLTPWVGRLMAINLAVLVLRWTVFTAPAFTAALEFDPATFWAHPWTPVTHLFVHLGALHLAVNLLVLWIFGPALEGHLGGRRFVLLYLSCGLGSVLFAAGLVGVVHVPPLVGAGGAVLGVALAAALLRPDAEVAVFPLPVPLSAATVLGMLAIVDLLAALRFASDGLAHIAHLGGLITAYGWFRFRRLAPEHPATTQRGPLHAVMAAPARYRQREGSKLTPPPREHPEPAHFSIEFERAEMDRVLDKISASGLGSLTPAEKRFLRDAAERRTRPED